MIKAHLTYTTEHLIALARAKNRRRLPFQIVFRAGCVAYFISLGVLVYWYFRELSNKTMVWVLLCFFALAAYSETKKLLKLLHIDDEVKKIPTTGENRLFVFGEEEGCFYELIRDENEDSRKNFRYELIHKAEETDRFFVIFIKPELACIVGKNEIVEGSPRELRELLSRKLGSRFTVRKGAEL
ncbi:MAG: YcxB family protein [Ruminococcus sp.]|nr:YcxB family protein [Ruminococcus sp.]